MLVASALALLAAALIGAAPSGAGHPQGSPQESLAALALQQAQLTAGDGAADNFLGRSVAVSGDTALVGAYGSDGYRGSAYVFTRSGTSWALQQKLIAPDRAVDDQFGWSVAVSGDTALVGAHSHDVGANSGQGSAYVFTRSGTTWAQQGLALTAADGEADDWFGYAVALSGETALIGAHYDHVGLNDDQGSAYVFTRSGTTWTQQGHLVAAGGAATDHFGYSVSLSGDTALVGAPWRFAAPAEGSAYVFTRSGSTWTQQGGALTASDGGPSDEFGYSVALSGDTALVGAHKSVLYVGSNQGSAYVFTRSGASWSFQQKLISGDGEAGDHFGWSVALSGETALVGDPWDRIGTTSAQGSAYLFARSGTNWTLQQKLTAADGIAADNFGYAVALSGETALVGAPWEDVGSNANQGAAYVFVSAAGDGIAPVTTATLAPPANAAGWCSGPVAVTLTASDDAGGSGMIGGSAKTEYQIDFGVWTAGTSFSVSGDGTHTVSYRSTDAVGNTETANNATVKIDGSTPTISASGLPSGWSRAPVALGFTAAGGPSGAVAQYQIDGGAWTTAAALTISADGIYSLAYRALSGAGTVSATGTATVKIDTIGPTTSAKAAKGRKGKAITLKCLVSDNLSPQATAVTLTIKNAKRKVVKSFRLGTKNVATWYAVKWKSKAKGRYTYSITAKDLAGNTQTKAGSARITVK